MALAIYGIGVSRGIALGAAHLVRRNRLDVQEHLVPPDQVGAEIKRFRKSVRESRDELQLVRQRLPTNTPAEVIEFIDIHALMLEDSSLIEGPIKIMRELDCNAEWALNVERSRLRKIFEDMDDPYIRSRMDDVDQVIDRIQNRLHEHAAPVPDTPGGSYPGRVLVADDLDPADLLLLHHQGIAGLVTELGGVLSHTAILARSLKIPAVMGMRHARSLIAEGDALVIDGDRGVVMADPGREILKHYRERLKRIQRRLKGLSRIRKRPARTADGTSICLQANVDLPQDMKLLDDAGADGVGLYRTEYLFLNQPEAPDEESQFEVYAALVKALKGRPVTIRTLDLGADKQVDSRRAPGTAPVNPSLGLRAIRMCLSDPTIFVPQLRAILRASAFGPVRILIPMLSNTQELFQVKHLLQAIRRDLKTQGAKVGEVQLGGMIEVPAAALSARSFAKHLDFLSIGTNDLIQYTLAIDRIDDQVGYLYDPLHPSVLKLLKMTIDAAAAVGTPVSMCGEMAGDTSYTRLLLGMGLRDLSMHPGALLEVKQVINDSDIGKLKRFCPRIMRATNPLRIAALVRELNER